MQLETGKSYRAKTVSGAEITFSVLNGSEDTWVNVDLDDGGSVEPNVWLNTGALLWVSSEKRRSIAVLKAADEVIDALESSSADRI